MAGVRHAMTHSPMRTWVLGAGLAYFFVRCVVVSRSIALSGVRGNRSIPGIPFELLLVFAMVFQFYVYLWANIHNDAQAQGRYLLPAQLVVLLLFVSALRRTWQWSERRLTAHVGGPMSIGSRVVHNGAWAALLVFIVILHADSLLRHFVPYYRPLDLARIGAFEPAELDQLAMRAAHNVEQSDVVNGASRVVGHAADAQLIMTSDICRRLEGEAILRLRLRSDDADEFAVYRDRGDGFAEHRSVKHAYPGGTSELHLVMPGRGCERLRIDPRRKRGSTEIEEIAIAPYRLRHRARS